MICPQPALRACIRNAGLAGSTLHACHDNAVGVPIGHGEVDHGVPQTLRELALAADLYGAGPLRVIGPLNQVKVVVH